ncbi:MAG: amidohydrolase family protein [Propionivibrio sp.]|nr:amidohydrolase family protein [Propionivibrio sp.]
MLNALLVIVFLAVVPAHAQDRSSSAVIFENVRIFDGTGDRLSGPSNVLIVGGVIKTISSAPIADPPDVTVQRLRGDGRTLMPGLIDSHWHTMFVAPSMPQLLDGDLGYLTLLAGVEAEATLMRGFTTVRDLGGPSFALKRAIDEGRIVGPRIYPSGAMITITGGHGDFRSRSDLPRSLGAPLTMPELINASQLADSPDEVRMRTREQLLLGASQIKLTAGGGVASPHSPLDVSTFTEEELRAAVQAAANWGTYVGVHAYTPEAIQRSIAAGVKVIEHGHLMDEASARLIAEKGIWLSFQPFSDDGFMAPMPASSVARMRQIFAGTERTVALARKYKIKMAWGTDILFSAANATRQGVQLARMAQWYSAAEALSMATASNGELLQLSGRRNPYPGRLGVVQEGALADLLLVDGNPLTDIKLIENPGKNFLVIMKDGKVFKNLVR